MRTTINYNIWRPIIVNHALFAKVFDETLEKQKRDPPIDLLNNPKNKIWLPLQKDQTYKDSTRQEFKSLLCKIIYCLIEDHNLNDYGNYNLEREMDSLIKGQELIEIEDFIERLLCLGGINKKRMQATINYYTRSVKAPPYKIPNNVELPNDKINRRKILKNKTIDLADDLIEPVRNYIEQEIQHKNYYTNQMLMRAAVAFNIIQGTGMRITNAYQIKYNDLKSVYEKGEHKVQGLLTKHSPVDFCYVKCIDKRALKMALDMYDKIPSDSLNKISSKSPTRFQDMKCLFEHVKQWQDIKPKNFTSNMIRNYVADSMLNKGISLNKTSKLMNHASVSATKHYVNKYHPGPALIGNYTNIL
ncbi:vlf-1 [Adoxophyes orana granulovirus]|uniref:Very late expression factor 1 n=1 Tax=Adoxophyes orana granulovirus TaxID=170617 RepID=Q7T9S4_GVAO|nr:vlf-1 [Adoxophyes orana granulovirus]AAP85728.1 vlf-1 [Adoxophyes orana granulovirus]AJA91731.1 very late expression factor 1 [Adoxophyes orana granulovirus]